MALSDNTISNLAEVLTEEVIYYIQCQTGYVEFMEAAISEALKEKLGPLDEILKGDITMMIMDRTCLRKC